MIFKGLFQPKPCDAIKVLSNEENKKKIENCDKLNVKNTASQ